MVLNIIEQKKLNNNINDLKPIELNIYTMSQTSKTIEEKYKKYTDHQHILELPDTYIGGIQEDNINQWILQDNKVVLKNIKYVPGLYKIFDEILVNARDHSVNDKTCNEIRVSINQEEGSITVWNNGEDGIPIAMHKDENCYVPEMIFSHIRTSSHYGEEKKTTGGKNGIGSKAANIFSSLFVVEIVDGNSMQKYTQEFRNNMYEKGEPVIEKLKGKKQKSYTQITFIPDYARFGIEGLNDDMYALFKKRVYDIAACTNIKVFLDNEQIHLKNFGEYIKMYYDDEVPVKPTFHVINDRWKVGVVFDPNSGHRQISYVNGICTYQGGAHVNHVLDQLVKEIIEMISAKNKNLKIKTATVKENITIFIDSIIEDPGFSSQTKEFLTTKASLFGSRCDLPDSFIKEFSKSGIIDEIVNYSKFRQLEDLKKTDGKKKENLKGLIKLEDAHFAGTKKGRECTLILTEGDSAKPFALAGLELLGRDYYGVFPLKGKPLNVREGTIKQLSDNEEINNIKKIMGLKHGCTYKTQTDLNKLRYGSILILTDQDPDGSHIKGLIMNMIHFFWPNLLKQDGFLQTMATTINKAFKKTDTKKLHPIPFYTTADYNNWKLSVGDKIKDYDVKYYKGLGTSKPEEAKEAFENFEQKRRFYVWSNNKEIVEKVDKENDDEESEEDKTHESYQSILLAFEKKKTNDRKTWLMNHDKNVVLDTTQKNITYSDFINKDLIHFSNYDNERSLPSVCDGFKTSLRKILYGSILRNIFTSEIRVSQLAGFISDKAEYHHGEASLQGAIIGMAQNYPGSNNINWLLPNGMFGNRKGGGKNAASARYIYTQLNHLVKLCFRKEDNCILKYVDEDGTLVEPETYIPIICQLLINGSVGIGTGFSTDIPPYNPKDVITNTKRIIKGEEPIPMVPYWKGFKGKITKDGNNFVSHGIYQITEQNTVHITELPITESIEGYRVYLDKFLAEEANKPLKTDLFSNVIDDSGNNNVDIKLIFLPGKLHELIKNNTLEKTLKITSKISVTNLKAYDTNHKIKHYSTPSDILKEYCDFRLDAYKRRKECYLLILQHKIDLIKWRIQFVKDYTEGKIVVDKKTKQYVIDKLTEFGYPQLSKTYGGDNKSYDYLTDIKVWDLTTENRIELENEYKQRLLDFETYKNTTIQQLWLSELDEFEVAYDKWLSEQSVDDKNSKDNKNAKKQTRARKAK